MAKQMPMQFALLLAHVVCARGFVNTVPLHVNRAPSHAGGYAAVGAAAAGDHADGGTATPTFGSRIGRGLFLRTSLLSTLQHCLKVEYVSARVGTVQGLSLIHI